MPRPLFEIAREVYTDIQRGNWKGCYAAKPYLNAMQDLDKITDTYCADSAKSIVLYFLSNAATWRGETARRIKAELKEIVK